MLNLSRIQNPRCTHPAITHIFAAENGDFTSSRPSRKPMAPPVLRTSFFFVCRIAAVAIAGCMIQTGTRAAPTYGLPVTRNYALDEIGDLSRGVRLEFDRFGRLAVIGSDSCVVLNDTTWIDIANQDDDIPPVAIIVTDARGHSFFGSLASWGVAEFTEKGELRARNFRPKDAPDWVAITGFTWLLPREKDVYFAGFNGVVNWDRSTGKQVFFEVPGTTNLFALGSRVYVSSRTKGIQYLDLENRAVRSIEGGNVSDMPVDFGLELSDGRGLIATIQGQLLLFDGTRASPWTGPLAEAPAARVSSMVKLSDGEIAIAIDGKGLFIVSEDGRIRLSLTSQEYQRIHDLAAREPGVLWVATEGTVQKLLYGSPVTIVDRRSGVSIAWPQVAQWKGRTLITSSGRLYESLPVPEGSPVHFYPVAGQPEFEAWALCSNGSQMLVGNSNGVYSRVGDRFEQVLANIDVTKLVMPRSDLCYALGPTEIAVMKWENDRWIECAPRIPGVGLPAVVHAAGTSAWIELGADRVARVSLTDERIHIRLFNEFPWSEPRWVNLGVVDNTVVISGGRAGLLYFDEDTGEFCEAPELRKLLAQAPFPVAQVSKDELGTLWVTHEKGISIVQEVAGNGRRNRGKQVLFKTIVRDFQPRIQIVGENDIWIATRRTLFHVNRDSAERSDAPPHPQLISVTDRRTGIELYSAADPDQDLGGLDYKQNSLSFRFFSGGYSEVKPPRYEFTLYDKSGSWSTSSSDSAFTLHDLKEGSYRLSANLIDPSGHPPEPVVVDFAIAPPWHRSTLAYAGYGVTSILTVCGLFFWSIRHTRKRNVFLEKLARERTEELESAMEKLNEETRNAATLAERNRLAGEIHDSLQQGLSGLMLQLDATLKLSSIAADVRSRLAVARNMVSFTRHEVQQAVWDLESPLLKYGDLGEALKKLAGLISSGTPQVETVTTGKPVDLPSATKHQLLRIAQEAITNAVRHAKADRIDVRLEFGRESVVLEIIDDGTGFNPDEVFSSGLGHFGLRGLRARAARINADLQITSAPDTGTTVKIEVPFDHDISLTRQHASVAAE